MLVHFSEAIGAIYFYICLAAGVGVAALGVCGVGFTNFFLLLNIFIYTNDVY